MPALSLLLIFQLGVRVPFYVSYHLPLAHLGLSRRGAVSLPVDYVTAVFGSDELFKDDLSLSVGLLWDGGSLIDAIEKSIV
eukprot:scaffold18984_cov211-Skeletonema_marinoi.AAC.4